MSTRAIKHLAVPMISVFRNFAPIAITLVEWLWMKERKPSAGVLFSMALLIMGAVIAALNDLAFTKGQRGATSGVDAGVGDPVVRSIATEVGIVPV